MTGGWQRAKHDLKWFALDSVWGTITLWMDESICLPSQHSLSLLHPTFCWAATFRNWMFGQETGWALKKHGCEEDRLLLYTEDLFWVSAMFHVRSCADTSDKKEFATVCYWQCWSHFWSLETWHWKLSCCSSTISVRIIFSGSDNGSHSVCPNDVWGTLNFNLTVYIFNKFEMPKAKPGCTTLSDYVLSIYDSHSCNVYLYTYVYKHTSACRVKRHLFHPR